MTAMNVKENPRGRNELRNPSLLFHKYGILNSNSATMNIRQYAVMYSRNTI
eukprot:CAMPEP_0178573586 /NCGR_PEP_ID=MMETSP0697-20121206/18859_1 /TAXON_ID=265572 /ORGANISM="Extubocellulus spinifer, Strain CCMP396" /LENGTH=50 /DNA_ID=CAMNT_0020208439 /DNA_START=529 /DNA_END=681 /DNA_ORIENTATION=-